MLSIQPKIPEVSVRNQMEWTISVRSYQNIWERLRSWSTLTGQVISVGRTEMSPSIWQNYCPQYSRTALLYPACSTISKRVHLFKNRRLSAMLIFCKHNINAYDSKKDLYSPSPLRHPRTHTCHWYTDFKDLFMKTRPQDLLAHEPLNSLVMYAMENFPFTFV